MKSTPGSIPFGEGADMFIAKGVATLIVGFPSTRNTSSRAAITRINSGEPS